MRHNLAVFDEFLPVRRDAVSVRKSGRNIAPPPSNTILQTHNLTELFREPSSQIIKQAITNLISPPLCCSSISFDPKSQSSGISFRPRRIRSALVSFVVWKISTCCWSVCWSCIGVRGSVVERARYEDVECKRRDKYRDRFETKPTLGEFRVDCLTLWSSLRLLTGRWPV